MIRIGHASLGASGVRLRRAGRSVAAATLDFLFPADCFACGDPLDLAQHLGACARCWTAFRILGPPACSGCGLPRPAETDLDGPARGRCARCIVEPPPFAWVVAAVAYDDLARRFLLRAKLGSRPELLAPLATHAALALRERPDASDFGCVVPVPSHPWTTLRRGFSPAMELARPLARALGLPIRRWLDRAWRSPRSAKRLRRRGRERSARRSFRAAGAARGAAVLLVDDVMTTGATLRACAAALRAAGAKRVGAVVWARTLPGRAPGHAAVVTPRGLVL